MIICACSLPVPALPTARNVAVRSCPSRPNKLSKASSTCLQAAVSRSWLRSSRSEKDIIEAVFEDVRKAGFVRVRVDGEVRSVDEEIELDRYKNHNIEAVVDRLIIRYDPHDTGEEAHADRTRLTDSIETALKARQRHRHHQRCDRSG